MAKKKKQFKNYQDYLNSNEWKALKEEFYEQYDGFHNVCEISGRTIDKDDDDYMCLHHWQYASDWNNDSIDNLILVCSDVHDWIHDGEYVIGKIIDKSCNTKNKYKCELIACYIESDPTGLLPGAFERGQRSLMAQYKDFKKESNTKLNNLHNNLARANNHIDLLMEKLNG